MGINVDPEHTNIESVNDIDHVTGFTDEDLARFFRGRCARVNTG